MSDKPDNIHLYNAAKKGSWDEIHQLITLHPFHAWDWNYVLFGGAKYGSRRIVQLALDKGADDYNWGLEGACRGGHVELKDYLIALGATDWESGLRGAAKGGHRDIVEEMFARGAEDLSMALSAACSGGQMELIDELRAKGAIVTDHTWLCTAAQGQVGVLRKFAEGAQPNLLVLFDGCNLGNQWPTLEYILFELNGRQLYEDGFKLFPAKMKGYALAKVGVVDGMMDICEHVGLFIENNSAKWWMQLSYHQPNNT